MSGDTYVKYLETLVLSLLHERGHEKVVRVADAEAGPALTGSTCDPYLIRQKIVEKRQDRRRLVAANRALPCFYCQTDEHLNWKTFGGDVWWIACDKCGRRSEPQLGREQAGEQWNRENNRP